MVDHALFDIILNILSITFTQSWNLPLLVVIVSTKNREPKRLHRGKEFHKKVQKDWLNTTEAISEKSMTKPSGRKGRMDIFVKSDETLVAVVEIKASDWDAMSQNAIRRNVRRQACQIWDYIDSQLASGKEVSPGIIFPKRPKDSNRMNLIEELFNKKGIAVVWEDESSVERKARSEVC